MSTKNKKIVCFVDETGTAGEGNFSLGLVFVYAQETAKVDKVFSDLLPEGFNEFHANKHDDSFVRNILRDFAAGTAQTSLLMFNYHKHILGVDCRETIYAQCVIEAVKASAKSFRKVHKMGELINNIDVVIDANSQNLGDKFAGIVREARSNDGLFRAVNSVTPLDSSISRLLQVADGVAYSRLMRDKGLITPDVLERELKIKLF